ncbi:MAG: hypothetical protein M1819_002774 [Sarea resinae]|nr:MAG: hypothetical protein M1819_002774 [Sarea resinae]
MTSDQPPLRPTPRRPFELTTPSTDSSHPPSPPESNDSSHLGSKPSEDVSRTRSILNLTSSTLLGIYSPTGYDATRDEPSTPWGTGAETPSLGASADISPNLPSQAAHWERPPTRRIASHRPPPRSRSGFLSLAMRTFLLFSLGVAYGAIVTHLHDNQGLAPVPIEGIDGGSRGYLLFWGIAGVGLGSLLPWVDILWETKIEDDVTVGTKETLQNLTPPSSDDEETEKKTQVIGGLGADWNPAVRSIGAFVGIAFAIRKLPWQSTLQASLTLALLNPVLWYTIDRSKPGFILSAIIGITGTAVLLGINPEIVPSPATSSPSASAGVAAESMTKSGTLAGLISTESIGVSAWIASVLFCSCVCFGNIGRRLALKNHSAA